MSASRPFQGDTGEGDDFSSQRAGGHGDGPKVGAARGTSRLQGQSYEILRDSAAARPLFFASTHGSLPCSAAFVPAAPREVEKLRVFRLRPPVFSSFARAFFVRRVGRPLRGGEVRCLSRVRIAPPSATFRFFPSPLHPPRQYAHTQAVVCEDFTILPSPAPTPCAPPRSRGEDGREVKPSPTTH